MPNLYDINASLNTVLMLSIDEETGEINDEMYQKIEGLQIEETEKIQGIALYIEQLESEADAIKEKAKGLAIRAKAKENKSQRLREYLSAYLINTNKEKFETDMVKITFRKSVKCIVTDEDMLENWAKRTKRTDKVFKFERKIMVSELSNLIKSGVAVDGAVLSETQNMQIK